MDAYEKVLSDALAGDATLFAREDYVEEAWRIVDPVVGRGTPLHDYEPQTWGPAAVEELAPAGGWSNPVTDRDLPKSAQGGIGAGAAPRLTAHGLRLEVWFLDFRLNLRSRSGQNSFRTLPKASTPTCMVNFEIELRAPSASSPVRSSAIVAGSVSVIDLTKRSRWRNTRTL